jgi:hypothetical protein
MASESVLFIPWNRAVPGREQKSLELFAQAQAFFGKLRNEGKIASFETFFLAPHGSQLNGFVLLRGETQHLDELRRSDAFQDLFTAINVNLLGLGVIPGFTGEAISRQLGRVQKAI